MARESREPIRELTSTERPTLQKVARSRSEAAEVVGRAKSLLAVAEGASFAAGACAGGRKSGYGMGKLVARFNREGLAALQTRPSTGHPVTYTAEQQAQVLAEYRQTLDR